MTQNDRETTSRQDPASEGAPAPDEVNGLAEYNAEVLLMQPGLAEAFLVQLMAVPEPDDDATARIVAAVLSAERPEDLDRPWDSDGMRDYFDQALTVHSITRRPSDFTGGLGAYLGCEVTLESTGERMFMSTGGVSAVAQLVRAHTLGVLPIRVKPVRARKATRNGYWPYHLEILPRLATS